MRWAVGIDLLGGSTGALRVAAWMREASGGVEEFVGIHVAERDPIEDDELVLEQTALGLDAELLSLFAEKSPANPLRDAVTVIGPSKVDGLARAFASLECDALLLGKRAERKSHALGPTVGGILRRIAAPTMIVGEDASTDTLGGGPVVLATDLGTASAAAGRLARRLADVLGRPLSAVYVDLARYQAQQLTESWQRLAPRRTLADVDRWVRELGLGPAECHLASGALVDTVAAVARDWRAPLLVCGARRLRVAGGAYAFSTVSELALHAVLPVLAVPQEPLRA